MKRILSILFLLISNLVEAQQNEVWVPDNGNGSYTNPVIHADYSDPDAIRVGDDFYMISSSFNHVPGLPILHSKDLVNWKLIGHALKNLVPLKHFEKVQHGGGVWAPSIRYHKGEFYIYYPDPDFGIYLTKAKNILGPWSEPIMVIEGKGLIDPCPLWDEDGRTYLVHAFAGSRAGIKSVIVVKEMNQQGTGVINDGLIVFDGHIFDPTVEGPKFYKRNGYYYIFAPAGGVATGWQIVLRSKSVYGPYERRTVMEQGTTAINGPHQGAWVETRTGESWFLHFQDKDAYGRIVHLQPMKWINDWPVIGIDKDGDGKGEPVTVYKKPLITVAKNISVPATSDEFNDTKLSLQWQWQANPGINWMFFFNGRLRLYTQQLSDTSSLWNHPAMIMQKFPAEEFIATTRIKFQPMTGTESVGLMILGTDYAYISIEKNEGADQPSIIFASARDGERKNIITRHSSVPLPNTSDIYLRVEVAKNATCSFSYSVDGISFTKFDNIFTAKPGKWVGAKIGFFTTRDKRSNDSGYADIDWIRFQKRAD